MDETGSFWTDPDAIAANAAGRVTPAQYELVAGRRARGAPVVAGVVIALATVPAVLFVEHLVAGGSVAVTVLATVAINAVSLYSRSWRARAARITNLTDPAIDSGIGVLRKDGAIVLPGTNLRREPKLPPPGWYHLFWLRDRGGGESAVHRLLSVRPVPVAELARWRPEELARVGDGLRSVFGTAPADPTPEVRRLLRRRVRRVAGAVALSLGLLAVLVAIGYGMAVGHLFALVEPGMLPLLALPLVIGDAWSKARDARGLRAVLDGRQPVLALETPVLLVQNEASHRVVAGELDFEVSAEVAAAFEPGRTYTLYYLPRPRQLLYAQPAVRDEPVDS